MFVLWLVTGKDVSHFPHVAKLINFKDFPIGKSAVINYTRCYKLVRQNRVSVLIFSFFCYSRLFRVWVSNFFWLSGKFRRLAQKSVWVINSARVRFRTIINFRVRVSKSFRVWVRKKSDEFWFFRFQFVLELEFRSNWL